MKKVLMVALATILIQTGFSQINQGQWLVGGNVNFTSSKYREAKSNVFEFSPNAGYFFINNFAGGLRLEIVTSKDEDQFGDEDKATAFLASPFVRYYFLPAAQKVNIFADASYGFGSVKYNGGDGIGVSQFAIAAGPAIFLTPNTALEITVGYNSSKVEDDDERTNSFQFGVGFQVHLGNGGGRASTAKR